MVGMKKWDGVVVMFKDVYDLISWEDTQNDDFIDKVEYECYECFIKFSLNERELRATQRAYDHVTWGNDGHSPPIYTAFCSQCQSILDIPTVYCCIDHQINLHPIKSWGALKIMVMQIDTERTLCPYIVFQAIQYYELTDDSIDKVMEYGKEHIPLFVCTPAGMMLHALQMGRSS